ncbi:DUF3592 domain-containing protein [Scandinavium manionii]|uniref:DUF3592 domain-containing protein n=1 Tax=Scandinavium manionii TaxID=2926520 RepID=UPI00135A6EFF|nr:DUF3592 domain-containing protein [Scandinavium manionii]MCS2164507.1 DUF3592 domain-containing protein [Scandinavium manionii]
MDFFSERWLLISVTIIFFVFFILSKTIGMQFFTMIKNGFTETAVLQKGIAVNADIISAQQTSMWGGGRPIYRLTLKFKTMENQDVEVDILKALTFAEIENLKPGSGTTIKYDKDNVKCIALYGKPLVLGDF